MLGLSSASVGASVVAEALLVSGAPLEARLPGRPLTLPTLDGIAGLCHAMRRERPCVFAAFYGVCDCPRFDRRCATAGPATVQRCDLTPNSLESPPVTSVLVDRDIGCLGCTFCRAPKPLDYGKHTSDILNRMTATPYLTSVRWRFTVVFSAVWMAGVVHWTAQLMQHTST